MASSCEGGQPPRRRRRPPPSPLPRRGRLSCLVTALLAAVALPGLAAPASPSPSPPPPSPTLPPLTVYAVGEKTPTASNATSCGSSLSTPCTTLEAALRGVYTRIRGALAAAASAGGPVPVPPVAVNLILASAYYTPPGEVYFPAGIAWDVRCNATALPSTTLGCVWYWPFYSERSKRVAVQLQAGGSYAFSGIDISSMWAVMATDVDSPGPMLTSEFPDVAAWLARGARPRTALSLRNMRLRNGKSGSATRSGGLTAAGAVDAELIGTTIFSCSAASAGGCMQVTGGATAVIRGSRLENCRAWPDIYKDELSFRFAGGGVAVLDSALTVTDGTLIDSNSAAAFGGGLYVQRGTLTVSNGTIIRDCFTSHGGSGIAAVNSVVRVSDATLVHNGAGSRTDGGGGLYALRSSVELVDTLFDGNVAASGPAFHAVLSNVTVRGRPDSPFGATSFINNVLVPTVVSTGASQDYGGIFTLFFSNLLLDRTLVANNSIVTVGGGTLFYSTNTQQSSLAQDRETGAVLAAQISGSALVADGGTDTPPVPLDAWIGGGPDDPLPRLSVRVTNVDFVGNFPGDGASSVFASSEEQTYLSRSVDVFFINVTARASCLADTPGSVFRMGNVRRATFTNVSLDVTPTSTNSLASAKGYIPIRRPRVWNQTFGNPAIFFACVAQPDTTLNSPDDEDWGGVPAPGSYRHTLTMTDVTIFSRVGPGDTIEAAGRCLPSSNTPAFLYRPQCRALGSQVLDAAFRRVSVLNLSTPWDYGLTFMASALNVSVVDFVTRNGRAYGGLRLAGTSPASAAPQDDTPFLAALQPTGGVAGASPPAGRPWARRAADFKLPEAPGPGHPSRINNATRSWYGVFTMYNVSVLDLYIYYGADVNSSRYEMPGAGPLAVSRMGTVDARQVTVMNRPSHALVEAARTGARAVYSIWSALAIGACFTVQLSQTAVVTDLTCINTLGDIFGVYFESVLALDVRRVRILLEPGPDFFWYQPTGWEGDVVTAGLSSIDAALNGGTGGQGSQGSGSGDGLNDLLASPSPSADAAPTSSPAAPLVSPGTSPSPTAAATATATVSPYRGLAGPTNPDPSPLTSPILANATAAVPRSSAMAFTQVLRARVMDYEVVGWSTAYEGGAFRYSTPLRIGNLGHMDAWHVEMTNITVTNMMAPQGIAMSLLLMSTSRGSLDLLGATITDAYVNNPFSVSRAVLVGSLFAAQGQDFVRLRDVNMTRTNATLLFALEDTALLDLQDVTLTPQTFKDTAVMYVDTASTRPIELRASRFTLPAMRTGLNDLITVTANPNAQFAAHFTDFTLESFYSAGGAMLSISSLTQKSTVNLTRFNLRGTASSFGQPACFFSLAGDFTMRDVHFGGCISQRQSGMLIGSDSIMLMENVTVGRSRSEDDSGACMLAGPGARVTLRGFRCLDSSGKLDGGCILIRDGGVLDATGLELTNCVTRQGDGAIFAGQGARVRLTDSTISGAQAYSGAALSAGFDSLVEIESSMFSNNTATAGYAGGALSLYRARARIAGSRFVSNAVPGGKGGAVYAYGPALVIASTTFEGNTAADGGAVAVEHLTEPPDGAAPGLWLSGCTFADNAASQGLYGGGAVAAIDQRRDFSSNSERAAAALANNSRTLPVLHLDRCGFTRNTAAAGGAAYLRVVDSAIAVTGSVFESNTAGSGPASALLVLGEGSSYSGESALTAILAATDAAALPRKVPTVREAIEALAPRVTQRGGGPDGAWAAALPETLSGVSTSLLVLRDVVFAGGASATFPRAVSIATASGSYLTASGSGSGDGSAGGVVNASVATVDAGAGASSGAVVTKQWNALLLLSNVTLRPDADASTADTASAATAVNATTSGDAAAAAVAEGSYVSVAPSIVAALVVGGTAPAAGAAVPACNASFVSAASSSDSSDLGLCSLARRPVVLSRVSSVGAALYMASLGRDVNAAVPAKGPVRVVVRAAASVSDAIAVQGQSHPDMLHMWGSCGEGSVPKDAAAATGVGSVWGSSGAGTVFAAQATDCAPCPVGQYVLHAASRICVPCPAVGVACLGGTNVIPLAGYVIPGQAIATVLEEVAGATEEARMWVQYRAVLLSPTLSEAATASSAGAASGVGGLGSALAADVASGSAATSDTLSVSTAAAAAAAGGAAISARRCRPAWACGGPVILPCDHASTPVGSRRRLLVAASALEGGVPIPPASLKLVSPGNDLPVDTGFLEVVMVRRYTAGKCLYAVPVSNIQVEEEASDTFLSNARLLQAGGDSSSSSSSTEALAASAAVLPATRFQTDTGSGLIPACSTGYRPGSEACSSCATGFTRELTTGLCKACPSSFFLAIVHFVLWGSVLTFIIVVWRWIWVNIIAPRAPSPAATGSALKSFGGSVSGIELRLAFLQLFAFMQALGAAISLSTDNLETDPFLPVIGQVVRVLTGHTGWLVFPECMFLQSQLGRDPTGVVFSGATWWMVSLPLTIAGGVVALGWLRRGWRVWYPRAQAAFRATRCGAATVRTWRRTQAALGLQPASGTVIAAPRVPVLSRAFVGASPLAPVGSDTGSGKGAGAMPQRRILLLGGDGGLFGEAVSKHIGEDAFSASSPVGSAAAQLAAASSSGGYDDDLRVGFNPVRAASVSWRVGSDPLQPRGGASSRFAAAPTPTSGEPSRTLAVRRSVKRLLGPKSPFNASVPQEVPLSDDKEAFSHEAEGGSGAVSTVSPLAGLSGSSSSSGAGDAAAPALPSRSHRIALAMTGSGSGGLLGSLRRPPCFRKSSVLEALKSGALSVEAHDRPLSSVAEGEESCSEGGASDPVYATGAPLGAAAALPSLPAAPLSSPTSSFRGGLVRSLSAQLKLTAQHIKERRTLPALLGFFFTFLFLPVAIAVLRPFTCITFAEVGRLSHDLDVACGWSNPHLEMVAALVPSLEATLPTAVDIQSGAKSASSAANDVVAYLKAAQSSGSALAYAQWLQRRVNAASMTVSGRTVPIETVIRAAGVVGVIFWIVALPAAALWAEAAAAVRRMRVDYLASIAAAAAAAPAALRTSAVLRASRHTPWYAWASPVTWWRAWKRSRRLRLPGPHHHSSCWTAAVRALIECQRKRRGGGNSSTQRASQRVGLPAAPPELIPSTRGFLRYMAGRTLHKLAAPGGGIAEGSRTAPQASSLAAGLESYVSRLAWSLSTSWESGYPRPHIFTLLHTVGTILIYALLLTASPDIGVSTIHVAAAGWLLFCAGVPSYFDAVRKGNRARVRAAPAGPAPSARDLLQGDAGALAASSNSSGGGDSSSSAPRRPLSLAFPKHRGQANEVAASPLHAALAQLVGEGSGSSSAPVTTSATTPLPDPTLCFLAPAALLDFASLACLSLVHFALSFGAMDGDVALSSYPNAVPAGPALSAASVGPASVPPEAVTTVVVAIVLWRVAHLLRAIGVLKRLTGALRRRKHAKWYGSQRF